MIATQMNRFHTTPRRKKEAGVALLIAIFALMLISVVAISLIVSAGTESALSGNYRSSTSAYYAATAGLEEGRGRLLPRNPDYFNKTSVSFIPTTGSPPLAVGQVRYITNPVGGEDVLTAYPDTEYAVEFPTTPPTIQTIPSVSPVAGLPGESYKWVRINAITEASINLDVNNDHVKNSTTALFFDGVHLNLGSTGKQALEVTSMAVLPNGTKKLMQYVVAPLPFNLSFPAAVLASGTYSGATPFGNQSASFGISGADFCGGLQQYAVGATNATSVTNLTAKVTPGANYPGTGGSSSPAPGVAALGSVGTSMQTFPDPLYPGHQLDLTTVAGLNQLVSEIQSVADYTVTDCTNPATLGSATNPTVTVVTGNCSLSGNPTPPGQGILLVRGNIQYVDHPYDGMILAIGNGTFTQSAARLTHFYGTLFLAQTVDPTSGLPLATPGTPTLQWLGGGGNPNLQYDSCILANTAPLITFKRLSFREISQ
jgi:hypothetical protein